MAIDADRDRTVGPTRLSQQRRGALHHRVAAAGLVGLARDPRQGASAASRESVWLQRFVGMRRGAGRVVGFDRLRLVRR